ncbi:DUF378 domain-containing protein [Candidatus Gracilibacteria bacterium]|nr:DUF378 domain-containing protein [Candidatus Gracilibacteria bacterium]
MKVLNIVTGILLAIGGLNWGLVGLGSFLNTNLNVVNLLLGSIPVLENIVYLVVGLSAIIHAFTCLSHCKK